MKRFNMGLNKPLISVLMTVYNSDKYLNEAIDSILAQTFKDFEFLIIDDGSTDKSIGIVNSYKDSRIILHRLKTNSGPSKASNIGLKIAKGKYVARMDADDISYPNRLELQLRYLEVHDEVVVLGGGADIISETGLGIRYHPAIGGDKLIKKYLFVDSPFIHPSVMYLREVILSFGGYDETIKSCIDYDLWARIRGSGVFANINMALIKYRLTPTGISISKKQQQLAGANKVSDSLWRANSDPLPINKWPEVWPKKYKDNDERLFFTALHIKFFRKYFRLKKYLIAVSHLFGGLFISPIIFLKFILYLLVKRICLK